MPKLKSESCCVCVLLVDLVLAGCSGRPGAIDVPAFRPGYHAGRAMELYDTDGDGFVAGEELENAPGLKATMSTLDTDGDGKVSEAEVAARVKAWIDSGIGVTGCRCVVKMGGKRLAGAVVSLEPDPFLEDVIQTGSGKTARTGEAMLTIPKEDRPTTDFPPGMRAGIYIVRITKPAADGETIAAEFNEETVLGLQIAMDDPQTGSTLPAEFEVEAR
ncbi:MAG: EF-hand domain-containing protein [Planctomycetota bacterium]